MSATHKEILGLSVPNIISNISIPLLSTVDTILMGHLSSLHLGAIGLGAMVFNFVYWNFGFLRMGTTGLTAQAYGAKNNKEVGVVLLRGLLLALLLAMLLLLSQKWLLAGSAWFYEVGAEHYGLVAEYFTIRMYAAPATMMMYVFLGWFFGLQNAVIPMIITIVINVVNIVVSYLLVQQYQMDISGVAWGTVIAQYVGLLCSILMLAWRYRQYIFKGILAMATDMAALLDFFRVNSHIFLRTICLTFVFAFFYRQSSMAGALALAANVILLQFVNWMSYGIDGFAYAAESMVGKYHGAKEEDSVHRSIRLSFYWGLGLAAIYALVYGFAYDPLLHLFSSDNEVIAFAQQYQFWMVIFPLIAFACYIWDGIFIGLLRTKAMRDSMFLSLLVFLCLYYFVAHADPLVSLWIAMSGFMIARGILLWWSYAKTPSLR